MFWKKKKPPVSTQTTTREPLYDTHRTTQPVIYQVMSKDNGRFAPKGVYGCKEAILKVWDAIPAVFSSRYVAKAVKSLAKVEFLDSTVTRSMRELREQGKIKYVVKDRSLGAYQKLD